MSLVLLRSPSPEKEEEVLAPTERGKAPTFWCALYREDGSLEVCVCGCVGRGKREGGGGGGTASTFVLQMCIWYHVLLMPAQIYQIPKFKLVFSVRNFSSAPKTLMDSGPVPLPR